MSKKRKRRKVPKDKATDLPKKYLSGLKGGKRSLEQVNKQAMSEFIKRGQRIPRSMFLARSNNGY